MCIALGYSTCDTHCIYSAVIIVPIELSEVDRVAWPCRRRYRVQEASLKLLEVCRRASSSSSEGGDHDYVTKDDDDDDVCAVCLVNKINYNIVLSPCGHYGYCAACFEKLRETKSPCPYCRADVDKFMNIINITKYSHK